MTEQPEVMVGLVASPGPASSLAERLLPDLSDQLAGQLPGVRWVLQLTCTRLVEPPAELSELVDAARHRLLAGGWHLAVCVTDLPLQTARRPVVAHASATHGVAVLSLPALGAVAVRRRASDAVVRLVGALVGDIDRHVDAADQADLRPPSLAVRRRIDELGGRMERDEHGIRMLARVVSGNLRLLLGMLRANRPWWLATRLSRALVAAVAAGVFALVTSDIWRLANGLGTVRLSLLALASIVGTTLTLVIGAGLWERSPRAPAREQVILFNLVTAITVLIGVLALYLALFGLTVLGVLLIIPSRLLTSVLGHAGLVDRLELACLASSIATVGGALGAGLESDEAVREAAYTYQPDREVSAPT